jgi:hypothetical protein
MSRIKVLLGIAGGLVVVALLVNFLDPSRSLFKLITGKSRIQAEYVRHFVPPQPMEPVGSEEAKVRIQAFAQSMNSCHIPTINILSKIAETVPERIRVEFLDTITTEGSLARQKAGIECEIGLLINDQRIVEVEQEGQIFRCEFHGPVDKGSQLGFLRMALEQELEKQYGADLTAEERTQLAAVWGELPQLAEKAPMMPPVPPSPVEGTGPPTAQETASASFSQETP